MTLAEEDITLFVQKFFDLGMSGLPMDSLFAALCADVLTPFRATGGAVYVLEEDLSMRTLCHFGLKPIGGPQPGPAHLFHDGPLSRAMNGELGCVTGAESTIPGTDGSPHVIYIPLTWRGFPYAVAVFALSNAPDLLDWQELLDLVASGLTLLIIREDRPHDLPVTRSAPPPQELTTRQSDILKLVAAGKTNRWIARELYLGQSTVGHELLAICRMLGVNSRTAAVREASLQGILTREEIGSQSWDREPQSTHTP
jgi:DNA-binding CsgD family transcriptional regulator